MTIIAYILGAILFIIVVYWLAHKSELKTHNIIAHGTDLELTERIHNLSVWSMLGLIFATLSITDMVIKGILFLIA